MTLVTGDPSGEAEEGEKQNTTSNAPPSNDFFAPVSEEVAAKDWQKGGNFLSRIFMGNLNALFELGNKRTLEMEDLGMIDVESRVIPVYARFKLFRAQEEELPVEVRSFWRVILKICGIREVCTSFSQ